MRNNKPKYEQARTAARKLFKKLGITALPIDLHLILDKLNIQAFSFTEIQKVNPKLVNRLKAKKCDAIVSKFQDSKECYIVYDDNALPRRIRFTIAHEIGHIQLQHIDSDEILYRSHNSKDSIEKEADAFAAEFLRPPILLSLLGIKKTEEISLICGVSEDAARICIKQIEKLGVAMHSTLSNFTSFYEKQFAEFINDFRAKKYCHTCRGVLLNKDMLYCPICGNKNISNYYLLRRLITMKYPKHITVDENSKAIICPGCKNEEIIENAQYCHICGTYLINKCTKELHSESCGMPATGNARYCIHCGYETTFYKNGILQSWHNDNPNNQQDNFEPEIFPDDDIPF